MGNENNKLSTESFFNFIILENRQAYTLSKNERLKSRKAIEQLFAGGKSFSLFPFKIIYQKEPGSACIKAAFNVSKRHFKKSVDRNRIKRLMREAYRLQKTALQSQLEQGSICITVFILYVGGEMPEYSDLFSKMNTVLKRLQKITNEAAGHDT